MSTNSAGAINIDVLANIANMVSDLGKVQSENSKATKEIQRQWHEAGENIQSTIEGIAAALGIGIGIQELGALGIEAIETAEKIDKLRASLGASAETLQTIQFVAATTGGSLDDAAGAFVKLERSATEAAAGSAQQVEAFRALGISSTQVKELMKDPDQLIQVTTQHLSEMADGTNKTAIMMELFGRGAAQNAKLFNELGDGFQKATDQARVFGIVLSDQDNKALLEANDALDAIGARMLGFGNQIGVALAPAIETISHLFVDAMDSEGFREGLDAAGKTVLALANNLGTLISVIELLAEFKLAQWAVGAAASLASLSAEAVIGASIWAEMTGGLAATEVAMAGVTAAGGSLLAVIGGLPGLIALAGVGIYELATHETEAAKAADTLRTAEDLLKNVTADSVQTDLLRVDSLDKVTQKQIDNSKATIVALEALQKLNEENAKSMASVPNAGGYGTLGAGTAAQAITDLKTELADLQAKLDKQHQTVVTASADMREFASAVTDAARSFVGGQIEGNMAKYFAGVDRIHEAARQMIADGADATIVHAQESAALQKLQVALDAADKSQGSYTAKVKETKAYQDNSAESLLKLQSAVDGINAKFGSPYQKAISDYNKSMDDLAAAANKAAIEGVPFERVLELWQQGEAGLVSSLTQTTDRLKDQADIVGQLHIKLDDETRLIATTGTAHEQLTAIIAAENEARKQYEAHLRASPELSQAEVDAITGDVAAHKALDDELKANQQAAKDWIDIFQQAGTTVADDFAKDLVEGGSAMEALEDVAKQVSEAILSYFLKLAVINPLLDSIFGGSAGFSLLPTLGGLFSGASGGGAAAVAGAAGQSAGVGGYLTSAPGWLSAGQKLWTGFSQGGFSGAISSIFGGGAGAASGAASSFAVGTGTDYLSLLTGDVVGPDLASYGSIAGAGFEGATAANVGADSIAASSEAATAAGGTLAAVASWIPIIGLIIAGMAEDNKLFKQGWQASNGFDFSSAFSNPIAGALAPGAIGVDLSDKFLRGIGFGDQFASILTGSSIVSRLFGHQKPKLQGGTMTESIGPDGGGGGVDANIRSKGGFFTSDKNWTVHSDLDADTLKAVQDFYDALKRNNDSFAEEFNAKVGDVVGGSFAQVFDKNGQPTGATTTTIGDQTYQNETEQQFEERLVSENELAILDQFDARLNDAVDAFRDDADTLAAVTNDLASVQKMFQDGTKFLALGSDQSLSAFLGLAEGMQGIGETIDQTMQRIAQSQQAYDQFVGQFKSTTYVDDFEAAESQLTDQLQANIKQANDLAKAAGAEGASVEDLTNIHEAAAKQYAQLLQQLEASAQSTAFGLGITNTGSLDDVNAEISRLQGEANSASSAVHGFGDAMSAAAEQATEAMSRLLGDNSPYNDEQKLQLALQGEREGTATAEQVEEIARRLYASGPQYKPIFDEAEAIAAQQHASGMGNPQSSNGLSASDQARLNDLLKERDQLQQQATLQQYQTFAQDVAEIAGAKEEDWKDVLAGMNVDIAAFEKGLGMNDAQTAQYIQNLMDAKDSAGENTKSIVDKLQQILDALLGGGPGTDRVGHPGGSIPMPPRPGDPIGSPTTPLPPPMGGRPIGPRGSRLVHMV